MTNTTTISALPAATPILGGEFIPVFQSGATRAATAAQLKAFVSSNAAYCSLGHPLNLVLSGVTTATSTSGMTADQIVLATALNGLYYNFTAASTAPLVLTATAGAGAMDTGISPSNAYVAIYAIYNPTTLNLALMGQLCGSTVTTIYSGANMPTGYTASVLVSVVWVGSSAQLGGFVQQDRFISIPASLAISTSTAVTGAPLSISSSVPPNAKTISGYFSLTSLNQCSISFYLPPASAPMGMQMCSMYNATGLTMIASNPFFGVALSTPQQVYYTVSGSGPTATAYISGYTI